MKKCDYCGKEITYFEQYCSDECHSKANKFYETEEKYTKLFSVLCAICVLGVGIGIFMFAFLKILGTVIVVSASFILAILLFFLPFPTENMISKFKIEKSVKYVRIISYIVFGFGIAFLIFSFIF